MNVDDRWCDWCGEEVPAAPCRVDNRVFCGTVCAVAYREQYPVRVDHHHRTS